MAKDGQLGSPSDSQPRSLNICRFCGREGRFYRAEPSGYVVWNEWAQRMNKTHHQEQCPGCQRFTVWRLGAVPCPPASRELTKRIHEAREALAEGDQAVQDYLRGKS